MSLSLVERRAHNCRLETQLCMHGDECECGDCWRWGDQTSWHDCPLQQDQCLLHGCKADRHYAGSMFAENGSMVAMMGTSNITLDIDRALNLRPAIALQLGSCCAHR